jgi:hypothetical protein
MEQQIFAAFLPLFTLFSELLEGAQEIVTAVASDESLACLGFVFATVLVIAAGSHFAVTKYTAACYQSLAWFRVVRDAELALWNAAYDAGRLDRVRVTGKFDHDLFTTVLCADTGLSTREVAIGFAGYARGPLTGELLSKNPRNALAARKAFWGATWRTACVTLTAEQRMMVYRYALSLNGN